MSRLPVLMAAVALVLARAPAARAEPAVLSLARAYLGPESTIEGIRSLHYVGTLERIESGGDPNPVRGTLDMVFAKPLRHRLKIVGPKTTMLTVLDGYDAWSLLSDNTGKLAPKFAWLGAADIRSLRDTAWENLYYYSRPEGGSLEDKGPATVDGIECERVDFTHEAGAVFERFFDRDTGRLVLTVSGAEKIRESGEILVDGVRFPRTVVSTVTTGSGHEVTSKATFQSIVINETLPPDTFEAPVIPPGAPGTH